MAEMTSDLKQHAHALIDRMEPGQVSAAVEVLETILDPVARSLADAPYEDEPISEEEVLAVGASEAWLKENEPIPHEEVLAEFGLTAEDFERMGRSAPESRALGR
jgi:hypothetical protein